jgi:FkbM family methyltransferase
MIAPNASSSGLDTMRLPDGREVATLCPENTIIAYDEIFVGRIYELFGITLTDGDTILDVGANVGMCAMWCGDRIARGTVHCFEPLPATFAALERNVRQHCRLDVRLHEAGAAARNGAAEFTFYPRTSTSSSMYPDDSAAARAESNRFIRADLRRRFGPLFGLLPARLADRWAEAIRRRYQAAEQVRCRLVRLSDVIDSEAITRIDLLRVDVEGAEFECLAGVEDRHWPLVRQAVVEVHEGDESRDRMERVLAGRGFLTESFQQAPDVFARHWLIYARRPGPSTPSLQEFPA